MPLKLLKNAGGKWHLANEKDMQEDRLIVPSCEKVYKKTLVDGDLTQLEDGSWPQRSPTSLCPEKTTTEAWIATWRGVSGYGGVSVAFGVGEVQTASVPSDHHLVETACPEFTSHGQTPPPPPPPPIRSNVDGPS